jgi:uncharacterized protein YjbI with pentapeptide repeats
VRRAADPPQRPDLPRQLEPWRFSALAHDDALAETQLTNFALPDQHAKGVTLNIVKLTNVDLSGSRLDDLRAADVEFDRCNLANAQSRRADVRRATIAASRLTGIRLSDASLCDVTVRDGRVDLASFGSSRLTRVTFEDCLLSQTDFLEAELDSVRFHDCNLTRADFRGARLRRCEIRRCNLTDLQGVESLRGAALQWPAIVELAGTWAAALGIEVLDAD